MLTVFPELLFLAPLSVFLARVALGIVFGYAALHHFEKKEALVRSFAFAEGILAAALIAGAWTQIAAIVALLLIALWFALPKLRSVALGTALLSVVLAVTLLISGAGPFAFDLPL